ncbi:hypothetical protein VF06_37730 [Nostoc linckia z4]|uniref:hypothetical protein n=2 Tax=Nostoc linckia TaxID=92942 RepID=UPI000C0008B6|nr:hypothetical protein [Nostoc linckia]PHJ63648.1 hypothetical protein VF03_30060 [Nostoc linckia z2]PHJ70259.1 hypothetical protein VF06_37730 [Nostoc linckia z4]
MAVLASLCGGCIFIWRGEDVEVAYLITDDGEAITDHLGNPINIQGISNMEIQELELLEGDSFPDGSFIPVAVPVGGGEYETRKIDLSGAQGFLRYIDVIADGSDTIQDARIQGKEIKGLSYETAFLNPANFTQVDDTIISPIIEGLSDVTIRLYF